MMLPKIHRSRTDMSTVLDAILAICFSYPLSFPRKQRADEDLPMEKVGSEERNQ